MVKKQKCKYIGSAWSHLKFTEGFATFHYFDTVWRKKHVYNYKPDKDKFGNCNYLVKPEELSFI